MKADNVQFLRPNEDISTLNGLRRMRDRYRSVRDSLQAKIDQIESTIALLEDEIVPNGVDVSSDLQSDPVPGASIDRPAADNGAASLIAVVHEFGPDGASAAEITARAAERNVPLKATSIPSTLSNNSKPGGPLVKVQSGYAHRAWFPTIEPEGAPSATKKKQDGPTLRQTIQAIVQKAGRAGLSQDDLIQEAQARGFKNRDSIIRTIRQMAAEKLIVRDGKTIRCNL